MAASALPEAPAPRRQSAVSMSGVGKRYGDFEALKNVDLEVAEGERIVICRPVASLTATIWVRQASRRDQETGGTCLISVTRTTTTRPDTLAVYRPPIWISLSFKGHLLYALAANLPRSVFTNRASFPLRAISRMIAL